MTESPETKLKDIEDLLCKSFKTFYTDGICAYAPTGESFIIYCSAGSKAEGELTKVFSTVEEAVDEFESTVHDIIKTGRGVLYWRLRPQLMDKDNQYYVRSRFLISGKPVNQTIMDKYYNDRNTRKR